MLFSHRLHTDVPPEYAAAGISHESQARKIHATRTKNYFYEHVQTVRIPYINKV